MKKMLTESLTWKIFVLSMISVCVISASFILLGVYSNIDYSTSGKLVTIGVVLPFLSLFLILLLRTDCSEPKQQSSNGVNRK